MLFQFKEKILDFNKSFQIHAVSADLNVGPTVQKIQFSRQISVWLK